ncbi:thioredoxin-like protein [Mycena capillaripes]|nr:thioredoxin-like protein [Mycena capillaripes]
MFSSRLLLSLVLVPAFVSAAVFPPDSLVKMLDAKSWKKAMKTNQTSLVAFVAPWCGHCKNMAPEYSKAALGLHPLLPLYAVDCDADQNKRLCAEQGVKGFPTVKVFPRGKDLDPILYEGERTASAFYYFATRRIPSSFTKLYKTDDIIPWIEKTVDQKRTLLLTKDKKVPLLWQVLANKYRGQLEFGTHRDRKGKSSVALGFEAGEKKESKVLVYSPGSTTPFRYEGINKFDSLSKFFDSVIDGTADLTVINEEAKAEEFEPTEEELEIQRKQEAQRMALLHGGFSDLIDFEQAIMDGTAENYHDSNGFGSPPPAKKAKTPESESAKVAEGTETTAMSATPTPEPHASATPTASESHVGKNEEEL